MQAIAAPWMQAIAAPWMQAIAAEEDQNQEDQFKKLRIRIRRSKKKKGGPERTSPLPQRSVDPDGRDHQKSMVTRPFVRCFLTSQTFLFVSCDPTRAPLNLLILVMSS